MGQIWQPTLNPSLPRRPPPACPGPGQSSQNAIDLYLRKFAALVPVYFTRLSGRWRNGGPERPRPCPQWHCEERGREPPEQGTRLYICPTSLGTICIARSSMRALGTGRSSPCCRCPSHSGALSGAPAYTPGEGIFSGCFRSSKFTQSSRLSCHKKSLWSGARARSGGGGTCEPWTGGGAPLGSLSPPLRLGGRWTVGRREVCGEGAVRMCLLHYPHSSLPSACEQLPG